jgi:Flp pilus assembly protein TadG
MLATLVTRLRIAALRFARAREAAAAVEFALITPFLITLYMGTIELSDLIAVDRRVTVISGTTGDLVARTDGNLPPATLTDYFKASEGIIMPYSKTGLKQVVTLVSVNTATPPVTTVKWSQAYNGGTARTVGQPYAGLTTSITNLAKGSYIVVGETSYAYKPLLGWVVKNAINLHRESYYLPRFAACISYNGSGCP